MPKRRKPIVALFAAPETSASVLYGLFDVLQSVGAAFSDMTTGKAGEELLDVRIVASNNAPFRCIGNVPVEPQAAIADLDRVDVAIVCDLYSPIDAAPRGLYAPAIAWLRRVHANGALIASVCSGSLVLAEGGLLDGRQCAGHWAYRDLFREHYPKVRFSESSVLNLESERDGVVTAGSVTAWQDLALYLIARLCGPQHALRTAKVFLLAGHEDGQLPFSAMSRRLQGRDAAVRRSQIWIAEHYASPNPVGAMAEQSGLTPRTFARRFKAATGYLPIDYVHELRVDEAKMLIEAGAGRLDDLGYQVGYEDPTFFRRLFKRNTGMTPAAYRKKFNGILALGATLGQSI